jgi:hypothetical protein
MSTGNAANMAASASPGMEPVLPENPSAPASVPASAVRRRGAGPAATNAVAAAPASAPWNRAIESSSSSAQPYSSVSANRRSSSAGDTRSIITGKSA